MIWLALFVAWPLVATGALLVLRRRRLARKARFAFASVFVGYVVLAMMGWAVETGLAPYVAVVEPKAYLVFLAIIAVAVAIPFALSLAAMYAVSQRFIRKGDFD